MTLENGKPLAQSLGEVGMTVDHLRWFAEEARRAYGRIIPQPGGWQAESGRQTPIGVVGRHQPVEFSAGAVGAQNRAALAAGLHGHFKAGALYAAVQCRLCRSVDAVKLPKGVFQLVAGSASEIAHEFLENPLCEKSVSPVRPKWASA